MCVNSKRHPHADVIIAWAEGKTVQKKQPSGHWHDVPESPSFYRGDEYRIKPEPVEVTSCNGVAITPMKEKPAYGTTYYVVALTRPDLYAGEVWRDDIDDARYFHRGIVHGTAKSALEHALAMLANKTEVRDV